MWPRQATKEAGRYNRSQPNVNLYRNGRWGDRLQRTSRSLHSAFFEPSAHSSLTPAKLSSLSSPLIILSEIPRRPPSSALHFFTAKKGYPAMQPHCHDPFPLQPTPLRLLYQDHCPQSHQTPPCDQSTRYFPASPPNQGPHEIFKDRMVPGG